MYVNGCTTYYIILLTNTMSISKQSVDFLFLSVFTISSISRSFTALINIEEGFLIICISISLLILDSGISSARLYPTYTKNSLNSLIK